MWALLSSIIFGRQWLVTDLITTPRYWFIPCIMVYYILFYLIRTYMFDHLRWAYLITAAIILASYFFVLDLSSSVMYADVAYMRIYYFSFMLLGATTAIRKRGKVTLHKAIAFAMTGLVIYYACMGIYKINPFFCRFQIISLVPLLFSVYWLYRTCEVSSVQNLLGTRIGVGIYFISTLTLEIYMVQYAIFSDKLNGIFPVNILLTYLAIFAVAYLLKCASRLFSQVFSDNPFCWQKIYQV